MMSKHIDYYWRVSWLRWDGGSDLRGETWLNLTTAFQ